MFIVFEGLDGSGSTTQAALLSKNIEQRMNKKVVQTKEPTAGIIGKLVRSFLQHKYETSARALQLLFAADREDHLHTLVRPALVEGKVVVSDRYFFSSIAFGAHNEKDFDSLCDLYKDFQKPDLVILLQVPPAQCVKRIESRGAEKELFEKEEVLQRVWKNYEQLAEMYDFIHLVDGTQSIEVIEEEVFEIVKNT